MSEEIAFSGAAEQARMIREGDASPLELVNMYLERIGRLDGDLNAFRVVWAERAREEARKAGRSVGGRKTAARAERLAAEKPLLGVPIALKDTVDIAGEVTMRGTDAFTEPAEADSDIARMLREAGAIAIGKTHLPELAICGFTESATWGVTRNPWDRQRSSGGSSGGSATAVASGMVPVASASDGAGSIRLPASSCGLFGLKPQRGRIPLGAGGDHWHGLSVNGCVSRTVADTALWLDVTHDRSRSSGEGAGLDVGVPPASPERPFTELAREDPGRLRVAWSTRPPRSLVPPLVKAEAREAVTETARLLGTLEHEVAEQDPDWGNVGSNVMPRYLRGIVDDVAEVPHPERLERRTRGFARVGRAVPESLLERALREEAADRERINAIFERYDVLMTPVMAGTAVPVRRWEGQGALRTLVGMSRYYPFCPPWNHLGNPAASVPAGFAPDGLPLAVQLVGRPGDEATLLRLSRQLERERQWVDAQPPIS